MSEKQVEEFASNLADLCLSSKPLINMLTNLAGEYEPYAGKIVNVLEEHLTKIEAYRKLAALHVMDSIIKNIRGLYPLLFAENIVSTYMNVYREYQRNISGLAFASKVSFSSLVLHHEETSEKLMVDLQTRRLMLRLRFSWRGIFPPEKLQAIDEQMKNIGKDLTVMSSFDDPSDYRIRCDLLNHQCYHPEPSKYRISRKRKVELGKQHISIEEDLKSPRKKTRRRRCLDRNKCL